MATVLPACSLHPCLISRHGSRPTRQPSVCRSCQCVLLLLATCCVCRCPARPACTRLHESCSKCLQTSTITATTRGRYAPGNRALHMLATLRPCWSSKGARGGLKQRTPKQYGVNECCAATGLAKANALRMHQGQARLFASRAAGRGPPGRRWRITAPGAALPAAPPPALRRPGRRPPGCPGPPPPACATQNRRPLPLRPPPRPQP